MFASEHGCNDVAAARAAWRETAPTLDPARLVFLDETAVHTDWGRRDGRGLPGERVRDDAPDRRWHTTTFLAGVRATGLTAPAVFAGPIDGASFLACLERIRVPTLTAGDIVVLENLSCRTRSGGRSAVERVGRRCASSRSTAPTSIRLNAASRS